MKKIFLAWGIFILSSMAIAAQSPRPAATPPIDNENVVKISTALIQLDVVVTDKNGNLIPDLKPEDFEITENGERQEIASLSFFSGRRVDPAAGNLNANTIVGMPAVGEVRRTVAIVIDDLGMSAYSLTFLKKELAKFVSEQIQTGDLVAIIKTSGTVGILQQFTTDKRKMLEIIESLKYRPATSVGLTPFEPLSISFGEQIANYSRQGDLGESAKIVVEQKNSVESLAEINRNMTVTSGALGTLNSTISAMTALPGRKSVLYAAEGVFSLFSKENTSVEMGVGITPSVFRDARELEKALRGITEFANRSTIAIYTLDPRGALPVNFSASDDMRGGMTERENGVRNDRQLLNKSDELRASQWGMKFLSEETSGKAFVNTNDLARSLRETINSQNGYYVLAYQPNTDTFDPDKRRFNKLVIKVKKPNLNVSYRSGFFNVAEDGSGAKASSLERIFLEKLVSPYKYTDINLRTASVYVLDEQSFTVRSFVNVNPKDLQFTDIGDGNKSAKLEILAITFNENGIPIAQVGRTFDIKVPRESYENLLSGGLTYNLSFSSSRRDSQKIKIAVRDVNTNRIGTDLQEIQIPNFDKSKASLSGILLQNFKDQEWQNLQQGKLTLKPADAAARMQNDTARRQFQRGTVLTFNYAVYASPSLRSNSQTQFVVLKDGKEVLRGAAEDLNLEPSGKLQRVNRGGAFLLGTDMPVGRYVLQISVSGGAFKEPETRQIDFDLLDR